MLSARGLRKALGRILPEALKRRFRHRLFGYLGTPVPAGRLVGGDGGEVLRVQIGDRELRVPAATRPDVEYHFRDNADSVEEMLAFVRAARETGGLLLDVGAARGLFAGVFCLQREDNQAVAYEPSPVLAADLGRLGALNDFGPRLAVRAAAVGREPGSVAGRVDAQGLIDLDPEPGAAAFPVEVTSLDAECARLGRIPDVVKVDVEGDELAVLAGAPGVLASRPLLFLELHLDLLERRGVRPREVVDLLVARGYRFESCRGRPLSAAAVAGSVRAVLRVVAR